jgi:hypothetical protein
MEILQNTLAEFENRVNVHSCLGDILEEYCTKKNV